VTTAETKGRCVVSLRRSGDDTCRGPSYTAAMQYERPAIEKRVRVVALMYGHPSDPSD
jgi:hypothetical protein